MKLLCFFILFSPIISFGQDSEIDTSCLCGGIKLKPNANGVIYVEWMPEYPGGANSLKDFLNSNVNLNPTDSGIVSLSFLISCTGTTCGYMIENIEGVISKNSENEILNALQRMSIWKPAKHQDKNVDIPFKLRLKITNAQIK